MYISILIICYYNIVKTMLVLKKVLLYSDYMIKNRIKRYKGIIMSIVKKDGVEEDLVGVVRVDDNNVCWDELYEMHNGLAKDLLDIQVNVATMAKENEDIINSDKKAFDMTKGLLLVLEDTGKELLIIQEGYLKGRTNLIGPIDKNNEEDIMAFIEANSNYISLSEKIASLSLTALTDILVTLKMPDELITKAIEAGNEVANTIKQGE